jgi:hypothetical protein
MVAAERKGISREALRKAIDELPDSELSELVSFVGYLQFKAQYPEKEWFEKVYDLFAPVREAIEQSDMSEEEVDQTIDDAIREVRRARKP